MFPGWWTSTGKYVFTGHHPGYHSWVRKHLMAALDRPGLTQEQAFREFVKMTARLKRVVERNPWILQRGASGLTPRLQNLAF